MSVDNVDKSARGKVFDTDFSFIYFFFIIIF